MRKLILCGAVAALSLFGTIGAADGLDKRLMRTNVECGGAFVTGFTLIRSEVQQFIGEAAADFCGDAADIARYTVVPASVDIFDLGEVLAYLETIGESDVQPVLKEKDSERRVVVSEVAVAEVPDNPNTPEDEFEPARIDEVRAVIRTTSRVVNGGW